MKKLCLCLLLVVVCVSFVFTNDISIGFGGSYEKYDQTLSVPNYPSEGLESGMTTIMNRFTADVFIDATYLQAAVGYSLFMDGLEGSWGAYFTSGASKIKNSSTYLTFSAYLKFPIGKKNKVTFFPMAGGKYLMNLTYKDSNGEDAIESLTIDEIDNLNEIWIKAGLGADIDIGKGVFVRITGLGGYKINSTHESFLLTYYELSGLDSLSYLTLDFEATIGLGIKL